MSHPSKRKGNGYERELVDQAKGLGMEAKRGWGSNGESMGEAADVDLLVAGHRLQAKRRGKLPAYLQIPDSCRAVVFRQDNDQSLVLMRWGDFLRVASFEGIFDDD